MYAAAAFGLSFFSSTTDLALLPSAGYKGWRRCLMTFWIVYQKGEPLPLLDDSPDSSDDTRSVPVELDERAGATVKSLLALNSFDVALALGALWHHAVSCGSR